MILAQIYILSKLEARDRLEKVTEFSLKVNIKLLIFLIGKKSIHCPKSLKSILFINAH